MAQEKRECRPSLREVPHLARDELNAREATRESCILRDYWRK
jgi:hypothetical protein